MTILSFGLFFVISVFPFVARNSHQNEIDNIAFFLSTGKTEELIAQGYQSLKEEVIVEDYGEVRFYNDYKRVTTIACFHPERECQDEDTGIKKIKIEVFNKQSSESITNITSIITRK